MITPAPRKPIPDITKEIIRVSPSALSNMAPRWTKAAAPTETSTMVRRPALRCLTCRSNPIRPPRTKAVARQTRVFRKAAGSKPMAGEIIAGPSSSELGAKPRRDDRDGSAVGVVGGVVHQLIVDRDVQEPGDRRVVIGLQNRFRSRMRQSSVSDQDAEAPGGEILLELARDAVDDAGHGHGVVRPAPALAAQRHPDGQGAVDIGELVGFDRPP